MKILWSLIAAAATVAWALAVCAEVIELKDGSKIEGKITSKTDTEVMVTTEGIEVRINGDEIKALDGMPYACNYRALYEQKQQEVSPTDAEARFKLALWCEERQLKDEMNAEIERVLGLNPNHEGANKKLGRLFFREQWRTPDELKKLGFVKKGGEWMTPGEAAQADGKVTYKGNWVRPDDARRFEDRQFSKYAEDKCLGAAVTDPGKKVTTHAVKELDQQIRRLDLLNMWKPTPEQLKQMWKILNEAEADRQVFLAKLNDSVPNVEAAWIALRNEALKGVVDSFDQDPVVERQAGTMAVLCGSIKKGVAFKLYGKYADKFLAILTPSQRSDFNNKYCGSCHSTNYMKGGAGRELRGTQAGVDFLEKVRALAEDDFNKQMCDLAEDALKKFGKGPQTLLGKKAARVGKRSAQDMDAEEMTMCDIMKRARLATDVEWGRTRFNLAAEIEAKNQEERLRAIATTGAKERGAFLIDGASQKMIVTALFDGNLREVVGMKLGLSASQMVVKASGDVSTVPEFTDGATAFKEMCTLCHDLKRVNAATKSPEGWRATVERRLRSGAIEDPKLVQMITDYLVNRAAGGQKAETK